MNLLDGEEKLPAEFVSGISPEIWQQNNRGKNYMNFNRIY